MFKYIAAAFSDLKNSEFFKKDLPLPEINKPGSSKIRSTSACLLVNPKQVLPNHLVCLEEYN